MAESAAPAHRLVRREMQYIVEQHVHIRNRSACPAHGISLPRATLHDFRSLVGRQVPAHDAMLQVDQHERRLL